MIRYIFHRHKLSPITSRITMPCGYGVPIIFTGDFWCFRISTRWVQEMDSPTDNYLTTSAVGRSDPTDVRLLMRSESSSSAIRSGEIDEASRRHQLPKHWAGWEDLLHGFVELKPAISKTEYGTDLYHAATHRSKIQAKNVCIERKMTTCPTK